MTENEIAEKIVKLLHEHPEGLTTVDIAKFLGSHRHTITKYIYLLIGEGKIYQREVGPAKICYLKRMKK